MSTRPRIALIGNPRAGKGRAAPHASAVEAILREAGADVRELTADSADESLARARTAVAEGVDVVAVVGGDGMAHLGVNAVAGTDTALAIIACGTGNDIATSLGLPVHDVKASAQMVVHGCRRTIDAVRTESSGRTVWFVGVLCGGFDAVVNERANGWSWPRGPMRYNLAIARELPVFRPLTYQIDLDGQRWDTAAMLVAVGNGPQYGGGMRIAPEARYDDGLLDVVVVGPMSVLGLIRAFPTIFKGTHVKHPAVTVRRARRVRLSTDRIIAYADGERVGPMPVELEAVPGAVTVLTPGPASDPCPRP